MSKEAVLKIRETEAEAKRIVSDANAQARKMIAEAEEEAKHNCDTCEKVTKAEFAQTLKEVRTGAEMLVEKNRAEADAEALKMVRIANANMETAANLIARRLVAECQ